MDPITLLSLVAGLLSIAGFRQALRSLLRIVLSREERAGRSTRALVKEAFSKSETAEPTLEDRLDELGRTMVQSARLLEGVATEIEARKALAEQAKQEAKDAAAASALTNEQLALIRRMGRQETDRGIRAAVWMGLLGIVFGAAAAVLATYFIRPGWDQSEKAPAPTISATPSASTR